MWLSEEEIAVLTGRKQKTRQIEQLRSMGLPFFVNASGRPIVARSAIEGGTPTPPKKQWQPAALRAA